MAEVGILEMSIAVQTALALGRAVIIGVVAVALSGWISSQLAGLRGRAKWVAWALLLAPFLTPTLLISYAYSHLALALIASPWRHEALYVSVLLFKLVPVALVVRALMPPPLSAEARHCFRTLVAPSFAERCRFALRGAGAGPWFAGGLVFLLAFSDFELASLWSIKSWTVAIFDAQTGGMRWLETLRLAALPLAIQVAVLTVLISIRGSSRGGHFTNRKTSATAFIYPVVVAIFVTVLPLGLVATQAAAGFRAVAENFVLGNEIVASVLFALAAAMIASGMVFRVARSSRALAKASRLRELSNRYRIGMRAPSCDDQEVRFGGTPKPTLGTSVLPGVPGLLGSLIVALLVLAIFQMPILRPLYDSPLPLLLALSIILLPLALLLGALLRLRHASPMRFIARQLGSRRLAWDLETQPRIAAFALLFCWAYFDFTAASILAPVGMTPVFVRLHNLAHYGQTAVLSAMLLAAFAVPAVLLLSTIIAGQFHARR